MTERRSRIWRSAGGESGEELFLGPENGVAEGSGGVVDNLERGPEEFAQGDKAVGGVDGIGADEFPHLDRGVVQAPDDDGGAVPGVGFGAQKQLERPLLVALIPNDIPVIGADERT